MFMFFLKDKGQFAIDLYFFMKERLIFKEYHYICPDN